MEAELKQLQKGGGVAGGGAIDQVTHLQAENTALLKSVQGMYICVVVVGLVGGAKG